MQTTNADIIIPFYVTDFNQSELIENNTTKQLIVETEIDGIKKSHSVTIGDIELNIGRVTTPKETYFSFRVIDGEISSIWSFQDIKIVEPSKKQ